ncbi:MAG: tetratricopeptide repeat protein, partial [Proteobacteria bacterium]|nr:tetratricopeptide repeat protein [Pseudomonadota bacterium]MBU1612151.1 tetratricopeptide repeat protein [Pseudomonadota bacterium]
MRTTIHRTTSLFLVLSLVMSGCAGMTNTGSFEEMAYPERTNGPELTAEQHERLGDDLREQGSPEMAYLQYTRGVVKLTQSGTDKARAATLEIKKAMVLFSQGHDEAALTQVQAVLGHSPDHPLGNEVAGAIYLKAGLTQEALTHFGRAIALDPSLWRTHQYLGVLASRQGEYDEAVRRFTTSLELHPGQPGTLNNLGVAYLMNSEYDPALATFRQALAAGAPQEKIYNNIGLVLARMGRQQEALETFRFAGNEAQAYNNLGYVLMLQGDSQGAIANFEKAIELSPSYYTKAFTNLKQARLAQSFRASGIGNMESSGPAQPRQPDRNMPVITDLEPYPTSAPVAPVTPTVPAVPQVPTATLAPVATQPQTTGDSFIHVRPEPVSSLNYTPFAPRPGSLLRLASAGNTLTPATSLQVGPVQTASAPEALIAQESAPEQDSLFGLHVASFKTSARTGRYIAELDTKHIEHTVLVVDLGEKGTWHRVLAGRFLSVAEATA